VDNQQFLFEEDPIETGTGKEIMQYLYEKDIMTPAELRSFWLNFDGSGETGERSGSGTWYRTIPDFLESESGREALKSILAVLCTIDGQRQMSYYQALRLLWSRGKENH